MAADQESLTRRIVKKEWQTIAILFVMGMLTIGLFILSLFFGAGNISYDAIINVLFGDGGDWGENYIIYRLRFPRGITAAAVGAGLAISGMAMQALFRNPMASPSTLGISSGAAFGASLSLAFGIGGVFGSFATPAMAFIMCMITMFTVYLISTTRHGTPVTLLLLAGVAVGAFFGGLTSFLHYIVEADALQNVVYWTLGGFERCFWAYVKVGIPIIVFGMILICLCLKELNIISLGEEQAESLGVNAHRVKLQLLFGTSLTVGGCVALSGVIGFVGLIIPHVCRALCGPNHKTLAPMCIVTGAAFMLIMDIISKSGVVTGSSLPVGVLTSMLGAPFFVYIMRKKKTEFW